MRCPVCGKVYVPVLDAGRLLADDRHIQEIYPDAEPWQREQLISGICSDECWDAWLGGE